jgi:hypothetical protein
MDIVKRVSFVLVALGSVFVLMLAFGVSLALATTTPSDAFTWPGPSPGGTASDVVAIVLTALVLAGACVYGYVALSRTRSVAEAPRLRVVTTEHDTEERRKAA